MFLLFSLFLPCYSAQEPQIDSSSNAGYKPDHVKGTLEFKNVYFNYPARPDIQVLHMDVIQIPLTITWLSQGKPVVIIKKIRLPEIMKILI